MNKKILGLVLALGLFSLLAAPLIASAQIGGLNNFGTATSLPTADLQTTVAKIINAALGLLGLVAVVIILIGGFKWMTAMGNDDNVKKAKSLILQGVIGLIIIVMAYAIAQFVISAINQAAGNG